MICTFDVILYVMTRSVSRQCIIETAHLSSVVSKQGCIFLGGGGFWRT